jgi:hypothetical protein
VQAVSESVAIRSLITTPILESSDLIASQPQQVGVLLQARIWAADWCGHYQCEWLLLLWVVLRKSGGKAL